MKIMLIAEDDTSTRTMFNHLFRKDYEIIEARNGNEAMRAVESEEIHVVLTDFAMPGANGIEIVELTRKLKPEVPVIVVTAYGSIEMAVDAMKKGAYNYVTKPVNMKELKIIVDKAYEKYALNNEIQQLRQELSERHSFGNLIGKNHRMVSLYELIANISGTMANVLIDGETGTGKEIVARAIHYNSLRRHKAFVKVDCAALPGSLLESELFGHEKGAFTGAISRRIGRFENAEGGTIFLDEIGNIPLPLQVKLLRVLQDNQFERVGGNETIEVDIRVIAATNASLEELAEKGEFRKDLYYRLNVVPIHIPPLRDRRDDIPLLAEQFLKRYAAKNRRDIKGFAPDAVEKLVSYSWPGNVRELENAIERAVVIAAGDMIRPVDVAVKTEEAETADDTGLSLTKALSGPEKRIVLNSLRRYGWSRKDTAEALGITRATLYNKMKKYGITRAKYG